MASVKNSLMCTLVLHDDTVSNEIVRCGPAASMNAQFAYLSAVGVPDDDDPNQGSTTSTTPDGEYVGRVAGDDTGYAGETGAEARSNDT